MISCNSLSKQFGALQAVDQVSFDLEPGAICAILGPNGAGKSTLMAMLCGLLRPDAGTLRVAGFDPVRQGLELRRQIGVVPDRLALLPELTIEEHLHMSGPIYGLDRQTTHSRSDELLELLGLSAKRRTLARECSHGMRKKTSLALALLHNPKVLMLDEPFEGIDPASSETIRILLHAIAKRGITILLTSHILPLVDRTSDRIMIIRAGRLIWDSQDSGMPESAEKLYFELAGEPVSGNISWLQSRP